MTLRGPATVALTVLMLTSPLLGGAKSGARLDKIGNVTPTDIRVGHTLATADTCFVTDNGEIYWQIGEWVIGQELYKSLMNPASSCPDPYPFTIREINMPMMFAAGTDLIVSVDIESVDYTTVQGCTVPGIMLAISQDYELTVPPEGGLYNIWIPLDTPFVVNGPFFAGFFIGNAIDPAAGAAVLTDTIPVPCVTYNIWSQDIGWIDLVNNTFWNFPGRLAMEVSGVPGGNPGGGDAGPACVILSPSAGDTLYAETEIWCVDTIGSGAIDYVSLEYSNGSSFVEFGRDYDDFTPLRDGVNLAEPGNGMSVKWNFSPLTEGLHTIRATIFDTLGRSSSDLITVFLEPTPPIATITTPDNGDNICPPQSVIMTSTDENLSFVQGTRKLASANYSAGIGNMSQLTVGDVNGNPGDGNLAVNGEFGTYYCGPVAATLALQAWHDRGITGLIAASTTLESVAETLATMIGTRVNLGTYDDDLFFGLHQYLAAHGDKLDLDARRDPNYFELRTWVEAEERIVIIGISGQKGIYMVVSGFEGWSDSNGYYVVKASNPLTGTTASMKMRDGSTYSELLLGTVWQRVDLMISLSSPDWPLTSTLLGADFDGSNGWSIDLTASGWAEDSLYFIQSSARDATNMRGTSSVLVQANCANIYEPGDYDNSGSADIGDLFLLVNYITHGGNPPVGGSARADANCDNYVNITDIVYYLNFIFGAAAPPCY